MTRGSLLGSTKSVSGCPATHASRCGPRSGHHASASCDRDSDGGQVSVGCGGARRARAVAPGQRQLLFFLPLRHARGHGRASSMIDSLFLPRHSSSSF
ncbi:hypothetical protein B296_00035668 [Ensete ventricosum]|uniref:Uncharacterized protein n=1 Tax=Ensete ventricosum TaxID=4639 RepID=A0A426XSY3_ENSVE|nr:hypothetical protein B296_00035668 [Ensete ventricosum]